MFSETLLQSTLLSFALPTRVGCGALRFSASTSPAITPIPSISPLCSARDGVSRVPPRKRKEVVFFQPGLHQERCVTCRGDGMVPCQICFGKGLLPRGAFQRNNTVHFPTLVGSKWTSVTAINGKWRHFVCTNKEGRSVKDAVVTLASTCGPTSERICIEIAAVDLKSRAHWHSGWTTLNDLDDDSKAYTVCPGCKGEADVLCVRCEGFGRIGLF